MTDQRTDCDLCGQSPCWHGCLGAADDDRRRMTATIEALKIALEQAADSCAGQRETGSGEVARWHVMAAPDWEALPVDLTGPSGDA